MINTWEMQDGASLLRQAIRILPNLVRLLASARRNGVPVVYTNDNFGRWRSNMPATIEQARQANRASARIVDALAPQASDYVVLKPEHSAFFATPLELLLKALKVHRLVIAGVSGDQCVLATAGDALLRAFSVVVPRDAIASATAARTRAILKHFRDAMDIPTPASRGVRWR
jgi:nicotinamidase-related amidase